MRKVFRKVFMGTILVIGFAIGLVTLWMISLAVYYLFNPPLPEGITEQDFPAFERRAEQACEDDAKGYPLHAGWVVPSSVELDHSSSSVQVEVHGTFESSVYGVAPFECVVFFGYEENIRNVDSVFFIPRPQ